MNNSVKESKATTAILSHEFRTPLNAIIGFSNLIIEEKSMSDIKIFADIIRESGIQLLNKVLNIIETGSKFANTKPLINIVNIEGLLSRICQNIIKDRTSNNGEFKYYISDEAMAIQLISDYNRLEKIVLLIVKCLSISNNCSNIYCNVYCNYSNLKSPFFIFGISSDSPLSQDSCRNIIDNKRSKNIEDYYLCKDGVGVDLAICEFLSVQINANLYMQNTSVNSYFVLSVPQNSLFKYE